MFLYAEGKKAYEVLKRCHDLFSEWQDEGHQFWNSKTGEIITENGIEMHDLVYRGHRNYNDYWKDCYEDKSESLNEYSDLSMTFAEDSDISTVYVSPEVATEVINVLSV